MPARRKKTLKTVHACLGNFKTVQCSLFPFFFLLHPRIPFVFLSKALRAAVYGIDANLVDVELD
jgi:hypothetical protein